MAGVGKGPTSNTSMPAAQNPEARAYSNEGHFGKGSMGPKVEAVMAYVEACPGEGIVTDIEHMGDALKGQAGTRIVRG